MRHPGDRGVVVVTSITTVRAPQAADRGLTARDGGRVGAPVRGDTQVRSANRSARAGHRSGVLGAGHRVRADVAGRSTGPPPQRVQHTGLHRADVGHGGRRVTSPGSRPPRRRWRRGGTATTTRSTRSGSAGVRRCPRPEAGRHPGVADLPVPQVHPVARRRSGRSRWRRRSARRRSRRRRLTGGRRTVGHRAHADHGLRARSRHLPGRLAAEPPARGRRGSTSSRPAGPPAARR